MSNVKTLYLKSDYKSIKIAAKIIKEGGIVAFPTETVYGLGADAFNENAIKKVFEVKNRPFNDPLIVHVADLKIIEKIAYLDDRVFLLIKKFWPGPLTLVLKKKKVIPDIVTNNLDTVAIRMPDCKIALKLIKLSTGALAAPSANPFGYISPTEAIHVVTHFDGKIHAIIDGGRTKVGVESTVLDLSTEEIKLLRPGGVSLEEIEHALKNKIEYSHIITGRSPGELKHHYSPKKPLFIIKYEEIKKIDGSLSGLILFKETRENFNFKEIRFLSKKGDIKEAAKNLYACLYELDNLDIEKIYIEEVPSFGIGSAIMDRIIKAANGFKGS